MEPVVFFDPNPINRPHYAAFEANFHDFIRSGHYILGEAVEQFETHFAQANGNTYAVGVSSGTDALLVSLLALGLKPNDEVLCPSFTFFATASCVVRLGAIPVWIDVHPEDFTIDLDDAKNKCSAQTKGIIPVHLFGQSCDADAVQAFAKEHHLWILEDVAQAQGARCGHAKTGSWGDMAAFSFFPTKNLGGFGDSGMIVTQNRTLFETAQRLRMHGAKVAYEHTDLGGNFRMDALQAALLDIKLKQVDTAIQQRRHNAQRYLEQLNGIESIVLPQEQPNRFHTWNQFTIRVPHDQRNALKTFLAQKNIGCAVYYPTTLDQQLSLKDHSTDKNLPTMHAHQLANQVLSLPIYPGLPAHAIDRVCDCIKAFFHAAKALM